MFTLVNVCAFFISLRCIAAAVTKKLSDILSAAGRANNESAKGQSLSLSQRLQELHSNEESLCEDLFKQVQDEYDKEVIAHTLHTLKGPAKRSSAVLQSLFTLQAQMSEDVANELKEPSTIDEVCCKLGDIGQTDAAFAKHSNNTILNVLNHNSRKGEVHLTEVGPVANVMNRHVSTSFSTNVLQKAKNCHWSDVGTLSEAINDLKDDGKAIGMFHVSFVITHIIHVLTLSAVVTQKQTKNRNETIIVSCQKIGDENVFVVQDGQHELHTKIFSSPEPAILGVAIKLMFNSIQSKTDNWVDDTKLDVHAPARSHVEYQKKRSNFVKDLKEKY